MFTNWFNTFLCLDCLSLKNINVSYTFLIISLINKRLRLNNHLVIFDFNASNSTMISNNIAHIIFENIFNNRFIFKEIKAYAICWGLYVYIITD